LLALIYLARPLTSDIKYDGEEYTYEVEDPRYVIEVAKDGKKGIDHLIAT
jgi:hypothetical protein